MGAANAENASRGTLRQTCSSSGNKLSEAQRFDQILAIELAQRRRSVARHALGQRAAKAARVRQRQRHVARDAPEPLQ
jgi:hypothetical protein